MRMEVAINNRTAVGLTRQGSDRFTRPLYARPIQYVGKGYFVINLTYYEETKRPINATA